MYKQLDFDSVPFGNSVFQITQFIINQETPERRYRHCLLQLYQKYSTMYETQFKIKNLEIDIAEIKEKIKSSTSFTRDRLLVQLEEKQYKLKHMSTLINDCLIEIETYTKILEKLPKLTREEFEAGELKYWRKRFIMDAKNEYISTNTISVSTIKALQSVGISIKKTSDNQLVYSEGTDDLLLTN